MNNPKNLLSFPKIRAAFKKFWGYDDFRQPQGEIIHCLLTQQDALIVMPTGGGKSICFQLPALLQDGLTLVISPLVALMENQVQELQQRQLPAGLLHSELPSNKKTQTLQYLQQNRLKLLYVSPETLLSKTLWERLCQPQIKINGLMLDEAHCLVQWGDNFRPAYRRLGEVRSHLLKYKPNHQKIPIAAFTATADPQTQNIIQDVLQLQQPERFIISPYRPNLHLKLQTIWTPRGRQKQLIKFIEARNKQTGLIYVRTRKDSQELANFLAELGYATAPYHSGLSPGDRREIEKNWLNGNLKFVICTSAFGIGINKPDVRWVIHYHAPLLLSEYIQEIGRGGRDGKIAEALTLIAEPTGYLYPEDKQRKKFFLNKLEKQYQTAQQLAKKLPRQGTVEDIAKNFPEGKIALSLLHSMGQLEWQGPFEYVIKSSKPHEIITQSTAIQAMDKYLKTRQCRWKFLLQAFGFTDKPTSWYCGHCDNCLSGVKK